MNAKRMDQQSRTARATVNIEERDKAITFVENIHEYTIRLKNNTNIKGKSVTETIHSYFSPFIASNVVDNMMKGKNWKKSDYYGKTKEEIIAEWAQASALGTQMHKEIEYYLNKNEPAEFKDLSRDKRTKEFNLFLDFWDEFLQGKGKGFSIYKTEWMIYANYIAGSIDGVLVDKDGNIVLLDWKRCKDIKMNNFYKKGVYPFDEFDDCNYSHYCLQLNFYRHILENFYGKKVVGMYLVVLHPKQDNNILLSVPDIPLNDVWGLIDQPSFK